MKKESIVLHVLSQRDGGPGQRWAMTMLREAGIPCTHAASLFVGHYGVKLLTTNKRLVKRASRLIYG